MGKYSWYDFMTEQDKAHDAVWGKKELAGFGDRPALLLIDIYYSVLGFTREPILESMRTWPMSTGLEGWEASTARWSFSLPRGRTAYRSFT
ncbi:MULTISPECIES: hypothetical protein [unclassified Paenibacillus]|uniref:hypothetical protein n=1 Tax=unclassified Paenibacillus TaxID=185978 RepID=UPI001AE9A667|nr:MULTISPECIES: hypothetical protein [unclassified Paenibacillus]MBP1156426.1 hypothetical protein [Paenibacillus sp. PvP091]MBP1168188.1 hypothetical protein [Paenibacillus sp. PvR098]MBP2439216.1 hypothetical protein [Paenibacillus sp. PvP052]